VPEGPARAGCGVLGELLVPDGEQFVVLQEAAAGEIRFGESAEQRLGQGVRGENVVVADTTC
jgi:hypothetical protein